MYLNKILTLSLTSVLFIGCASNKVKTISYTEKSNVCEYRCSKFIKDLKFEKLESKYFKESDNELYITIRETSKETQIMLTFRNEKTFDNIFHIGKNHLEKTISNLEKAIIDYDIIPEESQKRYNDMSSRYYIRLLNKKNIGKKIIFYTSDEHIVNSISMFLTKKEAIELKDLLKDSLNLFLQKYKKSFYSCKYTCMKNFDNNGY